MSSPTTISFTTERPPSVCIEPSVVEVASVVSSVIILPEEVTFPERLPVTSPVTSPVTFPVRFPVKFPITLPVITPETSNVESKSQLHQHSMYLLQLS